MCCYILTHTYTLFIVADRSKISGDRNGAVFFRASGTARKVVHRQSPDNMQALAIAGQHFVLFDEETGSFTILPKSETEEAEPQTLYENAGVPSVTAMSSFDPEALEKGIINEGIIFRFRCASMTWYTSFYCAKLFSIFVSISALTERHTQCIILIFCCFYAQRRWDGLFFAPTSVVAACSCRHRSLLVAVP